MTLVFACVLALAGPATGEAAARHHFEKAEKAYRVGNYDIAIAEYQAAYDAQPVPALLFNLAQAYRKRHAVGGQVADLRRAIEVFRAYLRDDPQTPKRDTVEKILTELRTTLAEVEARGRSEKPVEPPHPNGPGRLVVRANVADAEVWLDEGAVGRAPVEQQLAPGMHQLRVTRAGFSAWTTSVELHPDEVLEQTALLVPEPPPPAPETPVYKRWWFWTAVGGAVVAGTVTALALGSSSGPTSPGGPTIDLSR